MATLVLTAVGGLVGGPVGAALGGLVGQAVDRDVIFRPAARQGPRLADLSVQTSSYGTPIPRVWGTMRVAGTVIWSTDLQEGRSTAGGGKGQPGVTTYSYSVSFAVALSGRGVAGVGRIWADGNLLRGAAGDWKSDVAAFRLHLGTEDQPADPLIASAEGTCPAHRGVAYAVFEGLQLADFGNRIPSLTFELIADAAGPVPVGAIAAELGGGRVDGGGATGGVDGFSAYGDLPAVLGTLADACGGWWAPAGPGLALLTGGDVQATLGDEGAAADATGTRRTRTLAPADTVPRTVTVTHYDPARDWQTGLQRARRPGPGTLDQAIELPASISADAAKTLAERALARAEAARETRTVALGPGAIGIAPGAVVGIAGEAGTWRVTGASLEAMVATLTLVPLAPAAAPATASGGRVLETPDAPAGATVIVAAELPPLTDALPTASRVTVLANGTGAGWRRAALLWSADAGGSWTAAGRTAAPAIVGTVAVPTAAAPSTLFDLAGALEVELARPDMTLADADDDVLDAGANLALAGGELLQFGRAAQVGPTRWRLTRLLRGRRGTEAATGAVGDRFALVTAGDALAIDLPGVRAGTVEVMAVGLGETADPPSVSAELTGASVSPPSPVHLTATRGPDGVRLGWVRRSRLGWRWINGADAPLGEEAERYRVTLGAAAYEVDVPALTLAANDAPVGSIIEVRQLGDNGASPPATITLS